MADNNGLFGAIYNPDVLTCLANLSNDEVFTPPEVANAMLDMLPQDLFKNPDTKFLDPACKSGVFLREIAKRLIDGLEPQFPDLQERINHIFHEQIYGVAITELTSLLSRRSVYCSKYPNSEFSVSRFEDADGNIRFKKIKHTWSGGKCVFCGASKAELGRGEEFETYAYEWIHAIKPEEMFSMKFDVIISNPPYQLNDGGNKNSAKPIYQLFMEQAKKLKPRFISMIIPARWYAGGKGLDDFRNTMLGDYRVTDLVDYSNAKDCFSGISLGGGVCYFLWSRDTNSKECRFTNIHDGKVSTCTRDLNEFPVFVRYNEALSIIHKVQMKSKDMFDSYMGSRNPFGFPSFARGDEDKKAADDCLLFYSGGTGYVSKNSVTKGQELINKYKVMISRATSEHAGEPDSSGMYNVLALIKVLKPYEVCTDSYLLAYTSADENLAINCANYIRTKFFRFLLLQSVTSISLSKEKFQFVPMMDYSRSWTDAELYDYFDLDSEEINFIESMMKEKLSEGDN